jgi:hypothetical protein
MMHCTDTSQEAIGAAVHARTTGIACIPNDDVHGRTACTVKLVEGGGDCSTEARRQSIDNQLFKKSLTLHFSV